jgi:hypothetical protein
VYLIGTIGDPDAAGCSPGVGQEMVLADTGAAEYLDSTVQYPLRHRRRYNFNHGDVVAGSLVAKLVYFGCGIKG